MSPKRVMRLGSQVGRGIGGATCAILFLLGTCVGPGVSEGAETADPSEATFPTTAAPDSISAELDFAQALVKIASGMVGEAASDLEAIESNDVADIYAKAMCYLESGRIDEGAQLLEQLCNEPEAPPTTKKYLALAYLHAGNARAAHEVIEEYLSEQHDDAYGFYLRGVAQARMEESDNAKNSFQMAGYSDDEAQHIQLAVMQFPVDAQQRLLTVRDSANVPYYPTPSGDRAQADRPFNFTFLIANEYDSNVPLRPFFSGLGSGFGRKDSRFLTAAFADFKLIDLDEVNFGLLASTYNTFQYELNEFNIGDYMGGAYSNQLLLENWMSSIRYEFHTTLVDEAQFSNDHRLTPSLTRLQDFGHTTAYFEYNPIDNRAPALIPAQIQTADIYRVGVTQAVYTFEGNGRVYGGYQYADAFAEGTDFDRQSHMITGRIERPLQRNWILDLDLRYFFDNYENANSLDFYERIRDDDRLEVRAGVQKNFNRPVSFRFDYTYINNDSNTENLFGVRFYDYNRHILSTQLIFALH